MKSSYVLVATAVMLSLTACSSNKTKVDTVRAEELSTDFVAEGIKVTSSGCSAISKMLGRECQILGIEAVSTAASNGGTVNNRKNAMDAACAYALDNVNRWMGMRVDSNRTINRTGTSTEGSGSKETQNSSKDVGAAQSSQRDNLNDTKTIVTINIRQSASRYMEGWQPVKQDVVGAQEVSCTMGWSRKNTDLMKQARAL